MHCVQATGGAQVPALKTHCQVTGPGAAGAPHHNTQQHPLFFWCDTPCFSNHMKPSQADLCVTEDESCEVWSRCDCRFSSNSALALGLRGLLARPAGCLAVTVLSSLSLGILRADD